EIAPCRNDSITTRATGNAQPTADTQARQPEVVRQDVERRTWDLGEYAELNRSNLDDVVDSDCLSSSGGHARAIHKSAVEAIQIFDLQHAVLKMHDGVLATCPNAIRRLLIFQVNVDGRIVAAAQHIGAVVERKLSADLSAAQYFETRPTTRWQWC